MLNIFLIIPLLFLIMLPSVYASSKSVEVTVASPEIYPFTYLNNKNEVTGILADCLNNNTNKKYTYNVVILPWARALQEVKSNRINAIMPAVYTEQRAEYLSYPNTPIIEFLSDVLVKKASSSFTTFEDAKKQKKIIAKVRSKAISDDIKARVESAGLIILSINDPQTALKMLSQNRIDYFLGDPQIIKNIAKQAKIINEFSFITLSDKASPSFLAFSKHFANKHNINELMSDLNCNNQLIN